MEIVMTFKIQWDKASGEKLSDMKKKMDAFKLHVQMLQLSGQLPRGEIRWITERKPEKQIIVLPPADDPPPAPLSMLVRGPVSQLHAAGELLM